MNSKSLILLFSATLLYCLAVACSCKTCSDENTAIEVPDSIFSKTDKFISSKVGAEFFGNYIHPDFLGSRKLNGKYEVRYNFRMIDYDFVDEEVLIVTDSLGNIPKGALIKGIPDCMKRWGCNFKIDKNRAIEIGVANLLPEGIKEWSVEFRWSDVVNRYIWHVLSTTSEFGSKENYKADGFEIMIDPVNGEVLKKRAWTIR